MRERNVTGKKTSNKKGTVWGGSLVKALGVREDSVRLLKKKKNDKPFPVGPLLTGRGVG